MINSSTRDNKPKRPLSRAVYGSRPSTDDEAKKAESGITPDSIPKAGRLLHGL